MDWDTTRSSTWPSFGNQMVHDRSPAGEDGSPTLNRRGVARLAARYELAVGTSELGGEVPAVGLSPVP